MSCEKRSDEHEPEGEHEPGKRGRIGFVFVSTRLFVRLRDLKNRWDRRWIFYYAEKKLRLGNAPGISF